MRDVELLAERAHRRIGARGLRGDHDPHTVAGGGHRVRVRVRRLDGAVHAAEQIDLVGRLKHILEQPDRLRALAMQLEDLVRDGIAPIHAARDDLGRWIAIGMHGRQSRAGRRKVGVRRREIAIRLECFLYELIEPRVVVQAPPRIGRRRRRFRSRVQGNQRRLAPSAAARVRDSSARRGRPRGKRRPRRPARRRLPARTRVHGRFASRTGKSGGGEAGPSGAALRNTTISSITAVKNATATKPSITACVVAADRTTLPSTVCPRCTAPVGIDDARRHGAVGSHALNHVRIADPDVLSDQVRGDLSAHPRQRGDEGRADLTAHEPCRLQHAPNVSASWGFRCKNAEEHDAGQRKGLADGLQKRGGEKLERTPDGRQVIGHHETGDADENESDRGHEPRVRSAQHQRRERTEYELRSCDPDQRVARLPDRETRAPNPGTAGSNRPSQGSSAAGRRSRAN